MDKNALITKLLDLLTFSDAKIDTKETDDFISVTIELPPNESGILIGYHGEKIDALQLIVSLMFNHDQSQYRPTTVDIKGYRLRRQESLHELADKAAKQAIDSGREILLPLLPSHERRIVHLHLKDNTDVSTYSEGEGKARRLIIRPESKSDTGDQD